MIVVALRRSEKAEGKTLPSLQPNIIVRTFVALAQNSVKLVAHAIG